MYRTALRALPRVAPRAQLRSPTTTPLASAAGIRQQTLRFTSTTPASKGTWKGTFLRWGVAFGALYWYNTSPLFEDEANIPPTPPQLEYTPESEKKIEEVIEEQRRRSEDLEARRQNRLAVAEKASAKAQSDKTKTDKPDTDASPPSSPPAREGQVVPAGEEGMEGLEDEAGKEGAFNPETGEINWDCPCLGGMAHGPCGEEFKTAFSCFVYSESEPKGMDCIDRFQGMQDCFKLHPEIYAAELEGDEDVEDGQGLPAPAGEGEDGKAGGERVAAPEDKGGEKGGEKIEVNKTEVKKEQMPAKEEAAPAPAPKSPEEPKAAKPQTSKTPSSSNASTIKKSP